MGENDGARQPLPLHGLIHAGGRSSRMGTDKALLQLHGVTLLERLASQMLEWTESVTIASGTPERAELYRGELSNGL